MYVRCECPPKIMSRSPSDNPSLAGALQCTSGKVSTFPISECDTTLEEVQSEEPQLRAIPLTLISMLTVATEEPPFSSRVLSTGRNIF